MYRHRIDAQNDGKKVVFGLFLWSTVQEKYFRDTLGFIVSLSCIHMLIYMQCTTIFFNYRNQKKCIWETRSTGHSSLEWSVICREMGHLPLIPHLRKLLSDTTVIDQIDTFVSILLAWYIEDCDGSVFANHPLFSQDSWSTLQIVAYYDELEICNPLGSHA